MKDEPRIIDHLSNPPAIPLRKLVELTRDMHRWSAAKVDQPSSQHHRWYYCLANECERRGLDLNRIIKQ
jgi:hypothetical protein